MVKHLFVLTSLILALISGIKAQETSKGGFSYGILYMAGGRYDNVRMCVATGGGVKGGPIADIMFITKYTFTEKSSVTFNLPVMRPLLFGLAFQMLQFEPEFTFQYRKVLNDSKALLTGPGLGVSLNYGPDYKSDLKHKGDPFFAAGPFISWQFGLEFKGHQKTRVAGIRAFYVPLVAKDHSDGTVIGGALEYSLYF
jgi:hypothetical protein